MRLEILVGSEEPITYNLNESKMFLGSSETNEIVLVADGISRKHVLITQENDNFYITDQGSTNGTFLNDERLVPGRKTEFTSFFPIRLGDNVLITLLSDEEANEPESSLSFPTIDSKKSSSHDVTRQISLKDLQNQAKTKNLVLESKTKRIAKKTSKGKKVAAPKKSKINVGFTEVFVALMIGGAVYYQFFLKKPPKVEEVAVVGKILETKPLAPETVSGKAFEIIEPTSFENATKLMTDLKCTTDVEKYLCEKIPTADTEPWGVVQSGTKLNVMVDGTSSFEEARNFFQTDPSYEDLKKVAIAIYLTRVIPNKLDQNLLKDLSLNFILFKKVEIEFEPVASVAITIPAVEELRHTVNSERLRDVLNNGTSVLDITKNYYKSL
jgi:pSer/pThr/pTyr-binding forkhead associated (FHA) protein